MMISATEYVEQENPPRSWWEKRRLRYNFALIISMFLGYITLLIVVDMFEHIIADPVINEDTGEVFAYDLDFGGIAALFHCAGACMGLLAANLCYFLGDLVELIMPNAWVDNYRTWAWRVGTAFSCLLPFAPALLHLYLCLFNPEWYDPTPIYI